MGCFVISRPLWRYVFGLYSAVVTGFTLHTEHVHCSKSYLFSRSIVMIIVKHILMMEFKQNTY